MLSTVQRINFVLRRCDRMCIHCVTIELRPSSLPTHPSSRTSTNTMTGNKTNTKVSTTTKAAGTPNDRDRCGYADPKKMTAAPTSRRTTLPKRPAAIASNPTVFSTVFSTAGAAFATTHPPQPLPSLAAGANTASPDWLLAQGGKRSTQMSFMVMMRTLA